MTNDRGQFCVGGGRRRRRRQLHARRVARRVRPGLRARHHHRPGARRHARPVDASRLPSGGRRHRHPHEPAVGRCAGADGGGGAGDDQEPVRADAGGCGRIHHRRARREQLPELQFLADPAARPRRAVHADPGGRAADHLVAGAGLRHRADPDPHDRADRSGEGRRLGALRPGIGRRRDQHHSARGAEERRVDRDPHRPDGRPPELLLQRRGRLGVGRSADAGDGLRSGRSRQAARRVRRRVHGSLTQKSRCVWRTRQSISARRARQADRRCDVDSRGSAGRRPAAAAAGAGERSRNGFRPIGCRRARRGFTASASVSTTV